MSDTPSFNLTSKARIFLDWKVLFIVSLLFSFISSASDKYTYYHNIYKNYYSKTTDDFESILGSSDVDRTYVIQRGDSLYDISSTLFGSPDFWPKIWSINPRLGNPHLIYEGNLITFSKGSIELAPQMVVGKIGDEGLADSSEKIDSREGEEVSKSSEQLSSVSGPNGKVVIPAPIKRDLPPIALPKSLPRLISDPDADKDFTNVSSVKMNQRNSYLAPLVFKPRSIISTKTPESFGSVKGIFRGGKNASLGETVILRSKNSLRIGENLVAYENSKVIRKTLASVGEMTYLIQRTGLLRVDKSLGDSTYLAEVIESYDFVAKGNKFYRGVLKDIVVDKNSSAAALSTPKTVKVLGGEFELGRSVLGLGDIVYLSKGRNANIELDKMYLIYTNRGKKIFEPKAGKTNNLAISLAKIINLEDKVATAILVDNVDEVSEGDYLNIR